MATKAKTADISTDRARQTLCQHILQWCEQGVSNVKVRVNTLEKEPQAVWFYGRVAGKWSKLEETVEGPKFARQIAAELERLAASPHEAECQVRRKTFLDRTEFEIKFHHDKIVAHEGKQLRSYLNGILFYEGHAAPAARRRGIRRGPKTQVARF